MQRFPTREPLSCSPFNRATIAITGQIKAIRFWLILLAILFCAPLWASAQTTDCELAKLYVAKGKIGSDSSYYQKAIDLCPGYIRPYELLGNWYRKQTDSTKAIALFETAAELGSGNYKLYYLLAKLQYANGEVDEAHRNILRSLSIRPDYQKSQALKRQIEGISDSEGPRIRLFEPATMRGTKIVSKQETITVRGIATDKSGIAWAKINRHDAVVDENGNFLKDIPIQDGPNNITIEIADTLGNRSRLTAMVEGLSDTEGPQIVVVEPAARRGIKIVHNRETITVRGIATDKSGIAWAKINRRDIVVDEKGNFRTQIPVRDGANTITIEIADTHGNLTELPIELEGKLVQHVRSEALETAAPDNPFYGKSYAVVIGIDNYDKWPALEFATADAHAVKQRLERAGFDRIITILNKDATQRRILTALFDELPKEVRREDRVIFYFAGHGQTVTLANGGKRGYIIPVDGDIADYAGTAISMEQIRSLSNRISAKHILYVMDSCYSGLGLNRAFGISPNALGYIRKIASMRAVQIITAGGKGEQVQERDGHGLFTTFFLRAIDGKADINKDSVVTGTELGAFLRPTVSEASEHAQTPLYGRLEGEGEFLIFFNR